MRYPKTLYLKFSGKTKSKKDRAFLDKFFMGRIIQVSRVLWDPRGGIDYKVTSVTDRSYGDELRLEIIRLDMEAGDDDN